MIGTSPRGTVEVRLDDVQDEAGGDRGVVGVAAVLQDGHRRLRGEPVRRGHHAEGALERRSGREHAVPPRCAEPCGAVRSDQPRARLWHLRFPEEQGRAGIAHSPGRNDRNQSPEVGVGPRGRMTEADSVHGEYKVPGGKLVVVDLDVEGGVLRARARGGRFLPRTGRGAGRRQPRAERRPRGHRRRRPGRPYRRRAARGHGDVRPDLGGHRHRRPQGARARHRLDRLRLAADPRGAAVPRAAHGPGRGPDHRGRRGPPAADPARVGVGRARRDHRQLPVAAQRGRPRGRRAARHRGRTADLRRRRDVRGTGQHHHVLALRARRPRPGAVVRRTATPTSTTGSSARSATWGSRPGTSR